MSLLEGTLLESTFLEGNLLAMTQAMDAAAMEQAMDGPWPAEVVEKVPGLDYGHGHQAIGHGPGHGRVMVSRPLSPGHGLQERAILERAEKEWNHELERIKSRVHPS